MNKEKLKRERKKKIKSLIKEFSTKEIKESLEEFEEINEELNNEYSKRKDKEEDLGNFGWYFSLFGLSVFFVGIMFLGSYSDSIFPEELIIGNINNSLDSAKISLNNANEILVEAFKKLFIILYELGSKDLNILWIYKIKLGKFIWITTLIYWLGYLFLWKMFKLDIWVINNIYIPIYKGIRNKLKSRHSNS